ncbi:MAG: glycosyltransferase [Acetobacteraceae bacterium]|jgi:galactofuranosylgalactofuranosylrhamnosyl-N-acetylglucosaminyl-diphospho-decaprenol beta-1,5/1,6-galactofuranosyltransferase
MNIAEGKAFVKGNLDMSNQEFIIQNILLPGIEFGAPEDMYVRKQARVFARLNSRSLEFRSQGYATFDTFFNALSLGNWRQKTHLTDMSLRIFGSGRFIIRFGVHRFGQEHRWISESEITFDTNGQATINLQFWKNLEAGILYFTLEATSRGELSGGYFFTVSRPNQSVRLGVVITHFNRKQFVVPALNRLRSELLQNEWYRERIEIIVVDNSKNLTKEETEGVTHIPNENYGGAGGFTRGLLHVIDTNLTHCLFMDDDASCEIEAIKRGYSLLAFAKYNNLAIAGGQLREEKPWQLWEAGGAFLVGNIYPLYHNLNMREVSDLLTLEQRPEHPDYGAWWYFAFSVEKLKHFPFPFFVRGDDILFSLTNSFEITVLNGVAVWGEDFAEKDGPFTRYLALRSSMVLLLLQSRSDLVKFWRLCVGFFIPAIFSFNYGSASAINYAIRNVLEGPIFWRKNLDMKAVRANLAQFISMEKTESVTFSHRDFEHPRGGETRMRRFVRLVTINGMLLPSFLHKTQPLILPKSVRPDLKSIFRHKRIFYVSDRTGLGYTAELNVRAASRLCREFLYLMVLLALRRRKLRHAYREELPSLTSIGFWREIYPETKAANAESERVRRQII